MPNFAAFLSYVLVTTFTPGPNNIMSMSNASRYGFRKSIKFNVGVFFGFFIIMSLCSIFSVALFSFIPSVKPVMTYIGASYILWLAWKTYNSKPHGGSNGQKRTNTFSAGLFLQFVNPKVILYGITLVSTFIVPYYKSLPVLAGFALFLAFTAFLSTCSWALLGSVFQRFLVKNDRVINAVMALLLVYCAVSLFL
jgi:threonine/homoserine/homoserine lactone efflux protein